MHPDIIRIHEILELTGIELVSFGLAPNPNGFCYELPAKKATKKQASLEAELSKLLDGLDQKTENIMRVRAF